MKQTILINKLSATFYGQGVGCMEGVISKNAIFYP